MTVIHSMFVHLRDGLRQQLEVIISKLLLAMLEDRMTSDACKEVVLEAIGDLCLHRSFLSDIYINYDCSLHNRNLFEHLTKSLCKQAFPSSGLLLSSHLIAFRAVVSGLQGINSRISRRLHQLSPDRHVSAAVGILSQKLSKQKQIKRRYLMAT
eukprot:193569-Hanusia_phi.AAC.1